MYDLLMIWSSINHTSYITVKKYSNIYTFRHHFIFQLSTEKGMCCSEFITRKDTVCMAIFLRALFVVKVWTRLKNKCCGWPLLCVSWVMSLLFVHISMHTLLALNTNWSFVPLIGSSLSVHTPPLWTYSPNPGSSREAIKYKLFSMDIICGFQRLVVLFTKYI